jgi:RNA polymerase sigma factor (sigma-70 family)
MHGVNAEGGDAMAAGQLDLLQHLRRATLPRDGGGETDGKLLGDYLDRRDGAAFAALVRRHGPMVLGVCRRILGNVHDAEDAFQAAFLVLVRRAASVVPRQGVGNWLYGVAYRTALEARTKSARRRSREREGGDMGGRVVPQAEAWAELRAVLDEELSRLPEKYRSAIVLCELEGKTVKEAARQLGLPQGTLANRLSRGRGLLAGRLSRHGLAGGAAALSAALPVVAAPVPVPAPLVVSILDAATPAGPVSAGIVALTEKVVRIMLLRELQVVMSVLLAVVLLAAGTLTYNTHGAAPAGGGRQSGTTPPTQSGGAKARPNWKGLAKIQSSLSIAVAFVGDGKTLASGGLEGVTLWDLDKRQERASFKGQGLLGLYGLAIARGGKVLATADVEGGTVTLWDVTTGKELATLLGHQGSVRCVAFSPDGKTLASGGEDKTVRLWDVVAKKERAAQAAHEGSVNAVAFSPDGKTVATGSGDNVVKLWDVVELKPLGTLEGHAARVTALAYARDGKTLAAGGANATVQLWDVATRKERLRLKGQTGRADSLAFTPDSKSLAATGYEKGKDGKITGLVRIWDAATGEERVVLRADMGLPNALAFSPDGRRLALGGFTSRDNPVMSNDGSLEVWELAR